MDGSSGLHYTPFIMTKKKTQQCWGEGWLLEIMKLENPVPDLLSFAHFQVASANSLQPKVRSGDQEHTSPWRFCLSMESEVKRQDGRAGHLAPLLPLLSLVPCAPQRPTAGYRSCHWGLAERKMSQTETFWKERASRESS